jgi:hypothetical protein
MNTINKSELLLNLDKVHATDLGVVRIRRNLSLATGNVVSWCKSKIQNPNASILRKGKNYYNNTDNYVITVNAYSYTIITAHMIKK